MDSNFDQKNCDITWRIENFKSSRPFYDTPIFHLNNDRERDWYLRINTFNSPQRFNFYLESNSKPVNTTVCYDVSLSINEELYEKSGILTFRNSFELLIKIRPKKEKLFRNLLVKVHLRSIFNECSLLHYLTFRTIEEVRTSKMNFDIQHFNELLENHEFFFRLFPVCKNSINFEMKMWVTYEEDSAKTLHIDVTEFSKMKQFELCYAIFAEDPNGKLIGSVTQIQEFQAKSDSVCPLKVPFTKDALKSFSLTNHKLSLKCEFKISEGKITTYVEETTHHFQTHGDYSENISSKSFEKEINNLRDDFLCLYVEGKHADIVISAHGRKFSAHKTILSARSSVFAAMFDSDMAEKKSNLVEIQDIEPETLDQMLLFMYSEILQTEEYGNILKVFVAADKYQVLTLKEKCSMILKKILDIQNVAEILILADMHYDTELQNSVEIFICAHGKKVFQTQEWKTLMGEKPSLCCKVMHMFCMEKP